MRFSNSLNLFVLTSLLAFSGLVAAQKPATGVSPAKEAPAQLSPPGGIYMGYYAEDPASNPEDAMLGAVVLTLPSGDAAFSGAMFFTYVGCQSQNVGKVSGHKQGRSIQGSFAGAVDGRPQSGKLKASFQASTQGYAGSFTVDGGKQFVQVGNCIEYHIAPRGSFELFPATARVPADFTVSAPGDRVRWSPVASAAYALVSVVDPALIEQGRNPVVWQSFMEADAEVVSVPMRGKSRVVTVVLVNERYQRVAIGSVAVGH